jgi:hypothetical protein
MKPLSSPEIGIGDQIHVVGTLKVNLDLEEE